MATFKRQPHTFNSLAVGTGNALAKIVARTVSACAPAVAAGATTTGSAAMSGVAPGDLLFVSGSGMGGIDLAIKSVVAASTNGLLITWMNSGSATTGASTVTFNALAITQG